MSDTGKVFVANTTFSTQYDGGQHVIHKNVTRVQEGHPLLLQNPDYFSPVDLEVQYRWENATDEKREADPNPHTSGGKTPPDGPAGETRDDAPAPVAEKASAKAAAKPAAKAAPKPLPPSKS